MMTDIKNGGYAFPKPLDPYPSDGVGYPGMTLRDYFAGQALAGWLASYGDTMQHPCAVNGSAECVARDSYALADAMLAARLTGDQQ